MIHLKIFLRTVGIKFANPWQQKVRGAAECNKLPTKVGSQNPFRNLAFELLKTQKIFWCAASSHRYAVLLGGGSHLRGSQLAAGGSQ